MFHECHGHKTIPNIYIVRFLSTKAKANLAKAKFCTKSWIMLLCFWEYFKVGKSEWQWASLNGSWQIQAEECQGQYPRTKVLHQGQEACTLIQHELSQHEGAVTEERRVMNNSEILGTYFQCYWFLTCCQRNYNQGSTWGWKAMDD